MFLANSSYNSVCAFTFPLRQSLTNFWWSIIVNGLTIKKQLSLHPFNTKAPKQGPLQKISRTKRQEPQKIQIKNQNVIIGRSSLNIEIFLFFWFLELGSWFFVNSLYSEINLPISP